MNTDEPLLVEADPRMNRLLIRHATPRQMRLINEIVPLLDQAVQEDERLVRRQQVYRPQRKRASEIALIVKDVYRDLLSTSDKVFDAESVTGHLATIERWRRKQEPRVSRTAIRGR